MPTDLEILTPESDRIVIAICAAAIATFAWAGIISEACTSFEFSKAVGRTPLMSVFYFYSYFTNQVITILSCVMTLTAVRAILSDGMLSAKIYASTVVYTAVTAAIYELMLRRLWSPKGFWLVRDALMHDVLPASALIFWIFLAPKQHLTWLDPIIWLCYPAAYCFVTLAVGQLSGSYPYQFLSPTLDGGAGLLVRICALAAAFYVVGLALIVFSRAAR